LDHLTLVGWQFMMDTHFEDEDITDTARRFIFSPAREELFACRFTEQTGHDVAFHCPDYSDL
jgi:hypothetical protein